LARRPTRLTPFPYTTLFRSLRRARPNAIECAGARKRTSVERARLGEDELRDLREKGPAVVADHEKGAPHGADRRAEGNPARVLEGLARSEVRPLSDDPVARHHLLAAVTVDDHPSTPEKPCRGVAEIFDADGVGEGVKARRRRRALLPVRGAYGDADPLGGGAGHDPRLAWTPAVLQS